MRSQVEVGGLKIVFVRLRFVAGDRSELFRGKLTHIDESVRFERAGTARRLHLKRQLYLWSAVYDVQNSAGDGDVVLVIDARWVIVVGYDDRRFRLTDPMLDRHDQTAAILKVPVGQSSAEELKSHDRAGPFGFADAIASRNVGQPSNPIRHDADQHSIAPRFQNPQGSKTGKLRVVGMRKNSENGSQANLLSGEVRTSS